RLFQSGVRTLLQKVAPQFCRSYSRILDLGGDLRFRTLAHWPIVELRRANWRMGAPFAAVILAAANNPANNVFGFALVRVVPLFLSVADFVFASRGASRCEELSRILQPGRIS